MIKRHKLQRTQAGELPIYEDGDGVRHSDLVEAIDELTAPLTEEELTDCDPNCREKFNAILLLRKQEWIHDQNQKESDGRQSLV